MTADPGAYGLTADDVAEDRRVERDQEYRVLGAPADYLTPGEFQAAVDRRRSVFAGLPHATVEDMTRAAIGHVTYRPQIGSPDHALTVGSSDRRIADAVKVLRTAELNGVPADSDEWVRLMGTVRDRADEAMRTGLLGGDAA